jgi:hypothetical protein
MPTELSQATSAFAIFFQPSPLALAAAEALAKAARRQTDNTTPTGIGKCPEYH